MVNQRNEAGTTTPNDIDLEAPHSYLHCVMGAGRHVVASYRGS